jgi:hypothetical protein
MNKDLRLIYHFFNPLNRLLSEKLKNLKAVCGVHKLIMILADACADKVELAKLPGLSFCQQRRSADMSPADSGGQVTLIK